MFRRIVRFCRTAITKARIRLARVAASLRRLWRAHERLLLNNAGYAAALAAGLSAIVAQVNPWDLLAAVIATVLAVYAAVRQGQFWGGMTAS